MPSNASDIALQVKDLRVSFNTIHGVTQAVRGASFTLKRGRTLAIVGESGSGKSVTAYSILRLIRKPGEITGGKIIFHPANAEPLDITALPPRDEKLFRLRGGKIAMIFQEPMTALSPVHTIGNQICEAILIHQNKTPREAQALAIEMLTKVGIAEPERRLKQYPFEFSGGMRQRVVIAMALVCRPEILIADEPTTALDVTVQAQILRLIQDLQKEMQSSVIFITHDLGVVAQIADDVVVMQNGQILEIAAVRQLFACPTHPYTRQLLSAVPGYTPKSTTTAPIPEGYSFTPTATSSDVQTDLYPLTPNHHILIYPRAAEVLT